MNQGFVCDNSDILRCLSCTRDPVWGMLLEPLLLRGLKSNMWLEPGLSQGFIQSGLGNLLRTEPAQPWGSCPTAWLFPQWGFILSSVSIVSPLRPHCPFSSSPGSIFSLTVGAARSFPFSSWTILFSRILMCFMEEE